MVGAGNMAPRRVPVTNMGSSVMVGGREFARCHDPMAAFSVAVALHRLTGKAVSERNSEIAKSSLRAFVSKPVNQDLDCLEAWML